MLTKEQKDCKYCHFDVYSGQDFSNADDNCRVKIESFDGRNYSIKVYGGCSGGMFNVGSDRINYCPMCGRKL